MNDLIPYDPPKLLTEREVRAAGVVSNRRANVRSMLDRKIRGASLTIKDARGTADTLILNLPENDAEAVLALLLERDEQFLTSLNIELEK